MRLSDSQRRRRIILGLKSLRYASLAVGVVVGGLGYVAGLVIFLNHMAAQ